MATKRSTSARSGKKSAVRKAKPRSAKRTASKKTASKKPAAKRPVAKKPVAGKRAKKRAAKKRAPVRRFTSRTLDALSLDEMFARVSERAPATATAAEAMSCPGCVVQQIQAWGGGTVTSGSQTLQQLSVNAPCSDGRLADLRQRLRTCSSRTIPLSCAATVGFIIERACPFA